MGEWAPLMGGEKPSHPASGGVLRVLIAGGGVAGLETLLGLRALAGELVAIELLAVEHDFWYRPLAVVEPFDAGRAERFELAGIAEAAGACLTPGELGAVDVAAHLARTTSGAEIEYDVLVLACGASPSRSLPGTLSFRGPVDAELFRRLLGELEAGAAESVVFALPHAVVWSLPLYELALLTATHLQARAIEHVALTLVTPESAPLALFGRGASEAVAALLARRGVALHTGHYPVSFREGRLELIPKAALSADRVVTLPRLRGRAIAGIPRDRDGFVATDEYGRLPGVNDVYAAGDITRFPVKQGGIAAQQADAVATAIAAHAGAEVKPQPFEPVLRGLLLTGETPVHLRAELRGGRGESATVAGEPLWWPPAKIAGRYLAPFLASWANLEIKPPAAAVGVLAVEAELSAVP